MNDNDKKPMGVSSYVEIFWIRDSDENNRTPFFAMVV